MRLLAAILLLAQTTAAPTPTPTPQDELLALIRANSHPVALKDGKLAGPGAEKLLEGGRAAQFVVLSEEHMVREIPEITTALLRALQPAGYEYLAIESGTIHAQLASRPPQRGNRKAIFEFANRYPFAITFYSDQEAAMIADAGAMSRGKGNPVWGFDQEFGAMHILERILPHAPSARAREATLALIEKAREQERSRESLKKEIHFVARTLKTSEVEELRELYRGAKDREVAPMIESLIMSSTIYTHYVEARYYLNSAVRERMMKDVFMDEYRRAQRVDGRPPKVIVKAGHWHTLRGMNPAGVPTLGNMLSELANANGRESFHVAMHVHGPEGGWRDMRKIEKVKPFADAAPVDQFTLIDLRPMRQAVNSRKFRAILREDTRLLFFEADVLLILGGAREMTTTELDAATAAARTSR